MLTNAARQVNALPAVQSQNLNKSFSHSVPSGLFRSARASEARGRSIQIQDFQILRILVVFKIATPEGDIPRVAR